MPESEKIQIVEVSGGSGPIRSGQTVVFLRFFTVAEPIIADAQLDAGQITVAVCGHETAAFVILRERARQFEPECRGSIILFLHQQIADLAADLRAGQVIEEGSGESCERTEPLLTAIPL